MCLSVVVVVVVYIVSFRLLLLVNDKIHEWKGGMSGKKIDRVKFFSCCCCCYCFDHRCYLSNDNFVSSQFRNEQAINRKNEIVKKKIDNVATRKSNC